MAQLNKKIMAVAIAVDFLFAGGIFGRMSVKLIL